MNAYTRNLFRMLIRLQELNGVLTLFRNYRQLFGQHEQDFNQKMAKFSDRNFIRSGRFLMDLSPIFSARSRNTSSRTQLR